MIRYSRRWIRLTISSLLLATAVIACGLVVSLIFSPERVALESVAFYLWVVIGTVVSVLAFACSLYLLIPAGHQDQVELGGNRRTFLLCLLIMAGGVAFLFLLVVGGIIGGYFIGFSGELHWAWIVSLTAGILLLLSGMWFAWQVVAADDTLSRFLKTFSEDNVPEEHESATPGGEDQGSDLATLLEYLQRRMDLIAQISTAPPSWSVTKSWRDLVWKFTGNPRGQEVEENGQKYLLKYIVKSEDVSLERLRFETPGDDVLVALPHAAIGAQAFYAILENVIRNAVKHSPHRDHGIFRFTIKIEKPDEQLWQETFFKVTIADNLRAGRDIVEMLNTYLSEHIVDEGGRVALGNWGLKEIKICSAYLRFIRQEEIDSKFDALELESSNSPPLVRVSVDEKGHLNYSLYLFRPKMALLVDPPSGLGLVEYGLETCTFEKLEQRIDDGESLRHEFLVFLSPQKIRHIEDWLVDNVHMLPYRILIGCSRPENGGEKDHVTSLLGSPIVYTDDLDLEKIRPANLLGKLWHTWVTSMWAGYKFVVRESRLEAPDERYGLTIRDEDQVSRDVLPRLLFLDHRTRSDEYTAFEVAAGHYPFSQDGGGIVTLLRSVDKHAELLERLVTSVVVVDERIWQAGAAKVMVKKYSSRRRVRDVWRKRRVYIEDASAAISDFEGFVSELNAKEKCGCDVFDFIVIHRTVVNSARDSLGRVKFDKSWRKLEKKARWLILDSGGGPSDIALEKKLRHIEYSNIADVLIGSDFDKLHLTALLYALRAGKG